MTTPKVILAGGSARSTLSLTISGPSLDPDEITQLVGCAPDSAHRRGDPRERGVPFDEGMWSLDAHGAAGEDPNALLDSLFDRARASEEAWHSISARYSVSVDIGAFVGGGNRDLVIGPQNIQRMAAIGASLWVDMYCIE